MSENPQTHAFQTETKQLLDLMIHSLYSNREIFLRELISNASDALDKLHFEGITNKDLMPEEDLHIFLDVDSEARTLTIRDNGIGMTEEEVMTNIGTIAKSGTKEFMEKLKGKESGDNPDLIGQFGVGFYSSFLVADKVVLETLKAGGDTAVRWESAGDGTFQISAGTLRQAGTSITLHLKDADPEDGLDDFTQSWTIENVVRKYSDFVSYPIKMMVERQEPVLDAEGKPIADADPKLVREEKTLNSMKAIWLRDGSDVSEEEYKEFYKHISHDWNEPLRHFHSSMEGTFEAKSLLFLPTKAPFDLHYRDMARRGVQLYVKRVFIMDECKELMPDYLRFVKGVVDAEDLSLNVSREMLQQDRQIKVIRKHLVKKTIDAMKALLKDDREAYTSFWGEFGTAIKEGLLDYTSDREKLLDLVLFDSTADAEKKTTLAEYVERMKEDQDKIYVMTAPTLDAAKNSPHLEAFADKGIEVLLLTDHVDEVWLQNAPNFKEKAFQSVGKGEVDLRSDDEKKAAEKDQEEKQESLKGLLDALRNALQEDIKEVRLSNRLTSSPACLVTEDGGITPQMEMLMRQSGQSVPKVKRILEVNPTHAVLSKLESLHAQNAESDELKSYAQILYGQSVLAEGAQLADPAAFAKLVAGLMV